MMNDVTSEVVCAEMEDVHLSIDEIAIFMLGATIIQGRELEEEEVQQLVNCIRMVRALNRVLQYAVEGKVMLSYNHGDLVVVEPTEEYSECAVRGMKSELESWFETHVN